MMSMKEAELCFPQLLNISCRKPEAPSFSSVLIYILLSSISVISAALNLLVIISISHFRQLHSPTNFLLLSLAVSDLLVGLLVMPVEILLTETCWILGDLLCVLYYLIPIMTISASVGNMVLISADRYVAICDPLHYPVRVTRRLAKMCVLLCWTCSAFYSLFLLSDNLKQPGSFNSCRGECVVSIPGTADLVITFFFPLTVIIILYSRVFCVAVSQARVMKLHVAAVSVQGSKTVRVRKSELKAATTLGVLIVVFLVCFSPYYILSMTGHDLLIGSSTETIIVYLMYFNSCLNPVIYALFYPWFRKAIRLIVTLQILQPHSREADMLRRNSAK